MEHDYRCCHEKFNEAFEARYPATPLEPRRVKWSENEWEVWQLSTTTGRPVEEVGRFSGCCLFNAALQAHEAMLCGKEEAN